MTGDHGWPFPRGKSNLYDFGTHVPLAIQWGYKIKKGRIVEDFVSFTDELYDLRKDPYQLNNVAGDPDYAEIVKKLREQLMNELRESEDPRALGKGDVFDEYPYYGRIEKKK